MYNLIMGIAHFVQIKKLKEDRHLLLYKNQIVGINKKMKRIKDIKPFLKKFQKWIIVIYYPRKINLIKIKIKNQNNK